MIATRLAALLIVPVVLTGCVSTATQILQEDGASVVTSTSAGNIWNAAEVLAMAQGRTISEADLKAVTQDVEVEEMPTTITVAPGPVLTVEMTVGSLTCTSIVSTTQRTPQTTCVE